MAVRIRLKKLGRTHRPFFRVCAMDGRSPRDGRAIEQLGTYDPMVPEKDARAILNGERIAYWLSVGATPTPKVGTLIKKYGKDGTHLEAQAEAISKLSERRQKSIESAKAAAAAVEMPKIEQPKPADEAPAEGAEASETPAADAPAEEAKADDAAAEAPKAEEAKAEEPKAEEAAAEEPKAEEAKAEEKKEEAPAEEAKEEEKSE